MTDARDRPDPDTRLMFDVQAGDREALAALFERNHARIHALCARLVSRTEAEDLVQETFLRVQRHAATFGGESGFRPWLFRIARNVCNDRSRRMSRTAGLEGEWARERGVGRIVEAGPGIADRRLLEDALAKLSPEEREVVVLCRMHDMPHAEVGAVLGCSAAAARVRLHRAISRLRGICAEMEGTDDGMRSRSSTRS